MSNENMFEVAVRTKMRFPFRGMVTVEDLWDLSVENLDSIYKTLNSKVKQAKEESLLESKNKEDEVLEVQIEIVKHIVKTKLEENALRLQEKAKKEKKQKLLSLLSEKQDEDLKNKSAEEIQAMLDGMD
jgi:hypothetical protein